MAARCSSARLPRTGSEGGQEFIESLGATPVRYGDELVEQVRKAQQLPADGHVRGKVVRATRPPLRTAAPTSGPWALRVF
ncbi:hypothetical protein [Streptomyces sp. NPDC000878]